MTSSFAPLLEALRAELALADLDGFLVPMADEFQSEYVPPSAHRIAFLTGFTGSAAFLIVLRDKAAFFTDSRYTLQAAQQIDTSLFELFDSTKMSPTAWLAAEAKEGAKIGFDPWLHPLEAIERFEKALKASGVELFPVRSNPVDQIWKDRPAAPLAPILAYDVAFAGQSAVDKRKLIAAELQKQNSDAFILTDPSSIAWLLNIRGGDVPHTPLPLSYAILYKDSRVTWYVATEKVTKGLDTVLGNDVARHRISDFPGELVRLASIQGAVRVDPAKTPYAVVNILRKAKAHFTYGEDPCLLPKACKNQVEIDGMRQAHRRDGAALVKFFAWLEAHAAGTTELEAERQLETCRAANQNYRGPSFDTIAASGAHGAIVHYRATDKTNVTLTQNSLFLLDSGAQYLDGTTDVTRTLAIGTPTEEMRDRYTRVLKGHLALSMVRFPEGTTGAEIDVLARQFLWSIGLDYGHGTGHGVGTYLGVHEGPQSISKRGRVPLRLGMVISNEPGFYKTDAFGIRIENLILVVEISDYSSEGRKTLGFETLTCAPYDTRLINATLLSDAERAWVNAYHERVRTTLRPQLDPGSLAWLEGATKPI